jgi:hypothetical protein
LHCRMIHIPQVPAYSLFLSPSKHNDYLLYNLFY